jgi:hypothetical protein
MKIRRRVDADFFPRDVMDHLVNLRFTTNTFGDDRKPVAMTILSVYFCLPAFALK